MTSTDRSERPAAGRPSMADVGRLAGVSAQTVSRYFSGAGYVSGPTRDRITAAIGELGYRQNRAAGSLRARRTGTFGVLSVGEMNYGTGQILAGLSGAALAAERALLTSLIPLEYDARGWRREVRRAVDGFLSAPVDGIIVSTAIRGVEEELVEARAAVPVVNLSERHETAGDPSPVGIVATQHLIDLGHSQIVHVAGPSTRNEAGDREAGYRLAMERAGLEPVVIEGARDWWAGSGALAADALAGLDMTAVFAANDEIALGVMSVLERRGLRAPRDYSIVGVDDMPAAAFFPPGLTTARIDFVEVGRAAFAAALHAVDGDDAPARARADTHAHAGSPHPTLAPSDLGTPHPELIIRASTAPPR